MKYTLPILLILWIWEFIQVAVGTLPLKERVFTDDVFFLSWFGLGVCYNVFLYFTSDVSLADYFFSKDFGLAIAFGIAIPLYGYETGGKTGEEGYSIPVDWGDHNPSSKE